ncbi:MAG: hypothetical protein ACK5DD_11210 [Cyclobacteriaceae bacterium]
MAQQRIPNCWINTYQLEELEVPQQTAGGVIEISDTSAFFLNGSSQFMAKRIENTIIFGDSVRVDVVFQTDDSLVLNVQNHNTKLIYTPLIAFNGQFDIAGYDGLFESKNWYYQLEDRLDYWVSFSESPSICPGTSFKFIKLSHYTGCETLCLTTSYFKESVTVTSFSFRDWHKRLQIYGQRGDTLLFQELTYEGKKYGKLFPSIGEHKSFNQIHENLLATIWKGARPRKEPKKNGTIKLKGAKNNKPFTTIRFLPDSFTASRGSVDLLSGSWNLFDDRTILFYNDQELIGFAYVIIKDGNVEALNFRSIYPSQTTSNQYLPWKKR